jgi:16S rRNA (uracil1498-N3)-methyltransferase
MSERFFTAEPITSGQVLLEGPEAHHLLHVMRARVGDEVTLFDGHGNEFSALVESLARSSVTLKVIEQRSVDRELPFSLAIGVALPKGDRQKWLVEKLTELGVTSLIPLETQRGVAQPSTGALERLRRAGIEAAKQCGRNRLMQIAEPLGWSDWVRNTSAEHGYSSNVGDGGGTCRLVAHPGGVSLSKIVVSTVMPTQVTIGPEGGLTDAEVAAAIAAGWQAIDLGPRILRVETAAVAVAAALALR